MNEQSQPPRDRTKKSVVIERTYRARVEELWDLWTSKEGFESWWAPEGCRSEVHTIDARVGGTLHYNMIAVEPAQIADMKQLGLKTSQSVRARFTEIRPNQRLTLTHVMDFIPGVKPYEFTIAVASFRPARACAWWSRSSRCMTRSSRRSRSAASSASSGIWRGDFSKGDLRNSGRDRPGPQRRSGRHEGSLRAHAAQLRAFQRGEHPVGFACNMCVVIDTSDVSIYDKKQGVSTPPRALCPQARCGKIAGHL